MTPDPLFFHHTTNCHPSSHAAPMLLLRPPEKKERSCPPGAIAHPESESITCAESESITCPKSESIACPESDDINNDSDESDTGAPELWDPHAGLKLSELDGHVSDANMEMEEDLPPGGEEEVR